MNAFGHDHLFEGYESFSKEEKYSALSQLKNISWLNVLEQKRALAAREQKQTFSPYFKCSKPGKWKEIGKKLLSENKVAAIILAGGDASRFQINAPKGTFEIFPNISLFQIFVNKMIKAQNELGFGAVLIVLTSQTNHDLTIRFFEKHSYFSLNKSQVHFFPIPQLPLVDMEGKWFWSCAGQLAMGPSGNGEVFYIKEILDVLKQHKIEYITVIQVENPLADPFDFDLIGYTFEKKFDIVLKCFQRNDPNEKTGILTISKGGLHITEYLHADEKIFTKEGIKKYPFANVGNYCFSFSFFEKLNYLFLPFHLSEKKAQKHRVGAIDVLKCERFIFDALYYTKKSGSLCYQKHKCYAPLKIRSQIPIVQNLLRKEGQVLL